ncbi:putative surface protein SACOL0050 [Stegodyphus dumicola]|uniref:putative surface protein SACOL0050 n=1 Tax=Stegodyphus dumicola TaxID=202533 RepID=UPI0015A8D2BB|nr:putative surface protein SACOL0050 [Stegodyphus dumicola]
MEDFQKITKSENQLKKTRKENDAAAHEDLELDLDDDSLDLDDDNLDLDDHDDKDDADTNHGAHDADVDEDSDDADDDMDQDHDIDDDDNHNTNGAADDDDGTPEANKYYVNDVDQDNVAVVDEAHVNEDDAGDNVDDDDSHEANDDDDVDNDPNVQNIEETVKNKLNQFEQACADQANDKTPAKSAEIPKEQKNNPRKLLVSDIPVEAFEAKKNAEILGRKITVSYILSASSPKKRKKRAWKYKRRKFKRTSKTMKLLTQHDDEKLHYALKLNGTSSVYSKHIYGSIRNVTNLPANTNLDTKCQSSLS